MQNKKIKGICKSSIEGVHTGPWPRKDPLLLRVCSHLYYYTVAMQLVSAIFCCNCSLCNFLLQSLCAIALCNCMVACLLSCCFALLAPLNCTFAIFPTLSRVLPIFDKLHNFLHVFPTNSFSTHICISLSVFCLGLTVYFFLSCCVCDKTVAKWAVGGGGVWCRLIVGNVVIRYACQNNISLYKKLYRYYDNG